MLSIQIDSVYLLFYNLFDFFSLSTSSNSIVSSSVSGLAVVFFSITLIRIKYNERRKDEMKTRESDGSLK